MREFNFDDEENEFDDNIDDEDILHNSIIEFTHLGPDKLDIEYKLLIECMNMMQKSFLWRFRSVDRRINEIRRLYSSLVSLLEIEE